MSKRIYIFDTTLRDGEQSPGFSMTEDEKLRMAHQLAKLGVDIIEAGFPAASPGDFKGVERVAREVRGGPTIAGLARASKADIQAVADSVKAAAKPRIHTFIATSPIHMEKKLQMTPDQVVAKVKECVSFAKSFGMEVEFSAEDATRSDWRFLAQVFTVAVRAGATILNVPDTVGYTTPKEMYDLFRYLMDHVDAPEGVRFSCHCHDDLGLAVANSLAAVQAGVEQVECTVNGIGERAGNASLEEIVMALRTRADFFPFHTELNTREIYRTSRALQTITGISVQPNKAIVGVNAFAHEAGIHQHGVLADKLTYEIMKPEDVGIPESSLVLGKHSGRHAFKDRLQKLGYSLSDTEIDSAFRRFKELADKKKYIMDPDIEAIVSDSVQKQEDVMQLDSFQVVAGSGTLPTASVRLIRNGGEVRQEAASGDGPVDALYRAIDRAADFQGHLLDYQLKAVTGGQDALGEVVVRVEAGGRAAVGRGVSTDILEASARAYVAAVNRILSGRGVFDVSPGEDVPAAGWMQRAWGD